MYTLIFIQSTEQYKTYGYSQKNLLNIHKSKLSPSHWVEENLYKKYISFTTKKRKILLYALIKLLEYDLNK